MTTADVRKTRISEVTRMDTNCMPVEAARRRKRRRILLAILLSILVASPLIVSSLAVCVWSGRFELALDVVSSSGEHIDDVSYAAFFKREEAEWADTDTSEVSGHCFHPAAKDNGRFIADVYCSGKTWIFDIETSYTELRYIVVRVKCRNGKVFRRMAEIPAGRGPRSMSVSVP